MDGGGHNQRQLTRGFDARDPVWNPAGTRLVFDRFRAGRVHLWSMRASDGTQLRQLTSGNTMDFEPAWSPDGNRVAFTRGRATGDPGDIYVLDLGSGTSGTLHRLTHTTAYDHQVSWGPGGRRLVFERDFPASSAIMSITADGSGLVRLTHGQFFDVGPAFSPDGARIAFGSDRAGGLLDDLWIMTNHGTDLHDVRQLQFSEGFPDWQSVSNRPLRPRAATHRRPVPR
jgi:TolB protein